MVRHRSLAYLSCHGAVKAGDQLNIRQMKQLLDDLFHTEKPYVCPHGPADYHPLYAERIGPSL